MYQVNERLDTFSRKERDRIKDSESATKLRTLISKYGKAKVAAATKEAESEKRGKKITYRELRHRIENAKGRLKKGEVKKWDKEKGRWVSNKEEDVNEEPNWNDGVNVRWNLTPNKKEISLNYNGAVVASKKKETYRGKTKPESAVAKGLLDFKNKGTEHLAQNFIKNNPLKTKKSVNEDAPPTAKHERMVKHIKKSYKKDGKLTKDEKSIAYATAWKNYNKNKLS